VDSADDGSADDIIPGADTSHDNLLGDKTTEYNLSVDDTSNDHPSYGISDDDTPSALGELLRLPTELISFAQWAFGPEGFPVLQILAFGDFSYNGRFSRYNALLCRDTLSASSANRDSEQDIAASIPTFRFIRKDDGALWGLINKNADFFEACPTDPIVED
jgi:hypothetical protein